MAFSKLRKPVPERDRVVVIEQGGVADIATVYDSDDQAIYAESPTQDYAIPLPDLLTYSAPGGRIYLMGGDPEYIQDTKRLAALEKSIVLRQITQFARPPEEKGGLKIRDIMLYALIGVLLLGVIFK